MNHVCEQVGDGMVGYIGMARLDKLDKSMAVLQSLPPPKIRSVQKIATGRLFAALFLSGFLLISRIYKPPIFGFHVSFRGSITYIPD